MGNSDSNEISVNTNILEDKCFDEEYLQNLKVRCEQSPLNTFLRRKNQDAETNTISKSTESQ